MPLGSSSEAPVTRPGPSLARSRRGSEPRLAPRAAVLVDASRRPRMGALARDGGRRTPVLIDGSDHVEEVEQNDHGNRNAENPEKNAAHGEPPLPFGALPNGRTFAARRGSFFGNEETVGCRAP